MADDAFKEIESTFKLRNHIADDIARQKERLQDKTFGLESPPGLANQIDAAERLLADLKAYKETDQKRSDQIQSLGGGAASSLTLPDWKKIIAGWVRTIEENKDSQPKNVVELKPRLETVLNSLS